jgi:hypothetical protein
VAGGDADSGILLRSAAGLRRVALAGRPAPRGGAYRAFGTPAVLDARRIAFVAEAGTNRQPNLFLRSGGRWRTLATVGRDPGTRLAGTLRTLDAPAPAAGGVVFRATLDQTGREGLFFTRTGLLAAIVGSGDAARGGGRVRSFGPRPARGAGSSSARTAEGTAPGGSIRRDRARRLRPTGRRRSPGRRTGPGRGELPRLRRAGRKPPRSGRVHGRRWRRRNGDRRAAARRDTVTPVGRREQRMKFDPTPRSR